MLCNADGKVRKVKQKPTLFTMESRIMSDRNLNPVMEPNFWAYSCSNTVTMVSNGYTLITLTYKLYDCGRHF